MIWQTEESAPRDGTWISISLRWRTHKISKPIIVQWKGGRWVCENGYNYDPQIEFFWHTYDKDKP